MFSNVIHFFDWLICDSRLISCCDVCILFFASRLLSYSRRARDFPVAPSHFYKGRRRCVFCLSFIFVGPDSFRPMEATARKTERKLSSESSLDHFPLDCRTAIHSVDHPPPPLPSTLPLLPLPRNPTPLPLPPSCSIHSFPPRLLYPHLQRCCCFLPSIPT